MFLFVKCNELKNSYYVEMVLKVIPVVYCCTLVVEVRLC